MAPIGCLFIVAVLLGGASAILEDDPQYLQNLEEISASCALSENATIADVNYTMAHGTPNSKEGKCFVGCMLEKLGYMRNGSYDRQLADATARNTSMIANNPELLGKILQGHADCEEEVGYSADKCVTGPILYTCLEKVYAAHNL